MARRRPTHAARRSKAHPPVAFDRRWLAQVTRRGRQRFGPGVSTLDCIRRLTDERLLQLKRRRGTARARDERRLLDDIRVLLEQLVRLQRDSSEPASRVRYS